jgi:hypothetical protein
MVSSNDSQPPPLPLRAVRVGSPSKKTAKYVLSIALCIVVAYIGHIVWRMTWGWKLANDAKAIRLVYRTDHRTLLAACDDLRSQRDKLLPDRSWHPASHEHPDPNDPNIPKLIRDLAPKSITIEGPWVWLEMGGGPYHFGIVAVQNSSPAPPIVTKELTPRLWYYSEDSLVPKPPPGE